MFWTFKFWKRLAYRSQKGLTFRTVRAVKEIASTCKMEIMERCKKANQEVKLLASKLLALDTEAKELNYVKDDFGIREKISQPLFTENQAATIKKKQYQYIILIIGFILCETLLYYLLSPLVVPGLQGPMAWVLAIFFAIGVMMCVSWGFEQHFKHIHTQQRFRVNLITKEQYKSSLHKKWLGYGLVVVGFGFIIAAGIARILYLENSVNPEDHEEHMVNMLKHAQPAVSTLTMIFTLILGIYMAILKKEYMENSVLFSVYKRWKKNRIQVEKIHEKISEIVAKYKTEMDLLVEKNYQLVLDLQTIFKEEVDGRDNDLFEEYMEKKRANQLTWDMSTYTRYETIQGSDERLFKFGIYHDANVKEQLALYQQSLAQTTDLIKGREDFLEEELLTKESKDSDEINDLLKESNVTLPANNN